MPKAYEQIADDGRHGRDTFLRRPRTRVVRDSRRHQWEKSRALEPSVTRAETGATEHDTGLAATDLVFSARYRTVEAPTTLAEAFGVPVGTVLLERSYRTRHAAEAAPFSLVTSYLLYAMVAANPDLLDASHEPWPGGTHHQLSTVGVEIDRIEERFSARAPTTREARALGLPERSAVILLRKTSYDTYGRVVDVCDVVLPGDRTELLFTTCLERW
ncbi:GntR family transcriptional regulator [Streptomyces griseochromogenes]|uniref:Transcriptional regulator n=1 Tax=Streptomyces griseochromogenes TaxID=68214 RepID=A0A1B1ANM2_9ACTN|nr:UTRA domain-containing protein [Streptomyces griseochromogenes]ANP48173.1 transcriptional regulator [Streptomyces griseochromogenes]MBP2050909.1 GntR family transcriptional regulator [Streptomyces griseochromogenes]